MGIFSAFIDNGTMGVYTFSSHLKWVPVILLGYFGSIAVHFLLNTGYF